MKADAAQLDRHQAQDRGLKSADGPVGHFDAVVTVVAEDAGAEFRERRLGRRRVGDEIAWARHSPRIVMADDNGVTSSDAEPYRGQRRVSAVPAAATMQ